LGIAAWAAPAFADEWAAEARSDYVRLGPSARPTGGLEVMAIFGRQWRWDGRAVELGGELSAFGFDGGMHWTGLLGGVRAAGWQRLSGPVAAGLILHLDGGRVPACAPWGLCAVFDGLYPGADAALRYEPSERMTLALAGGPIAVVTLPWTGAAMRFGLSGMVRW
jgi:hypothetical protein